VNDVNWRALAERRKEDNDGLLEQIKAREVGEQKAIEYSIKLQRLIENLKYETEPPYPQLHHHKMIVAAKAYRTALKGMMGLVQLLSRNEDIPAAIRARMTENHRFKDAQTCFPETNWDEYGLTPPYEAFDDCEEDGPMDLEDQLENALNKAFPSTSATEPKL
jgi:hypothetical protein